MREDALLLVKSNVCVRVVVGEKVARKLGGVYVERLEEAGARERGALSCLHSTLDKP